MRAYIPLLIAPVFLVGCAGTMNQRAAFSCPSPIPAPILQAGDTWNWQDETGAPWHRRYVTHSDDGLFETEGKSGGPRFFFDTSHTLRKVYRDGHWITRDVLDYPNLGKPQLEFPLQPGKSWTNLVTAKSKGGGDTFTYYASFTVIGCEQVSVPAGTFFAVVIEEEQGVRSRGGGYRTWWYAPEVKYFVKLVHGRATNPSYWSGFRDWALTSYTLAKPVGQQPPIAAPPPTPSVPSNTLTTASPAPTVENVSSAVPPVWEKGFEWNFRWESPRGSGTFIREITGGEIVGGVPYYVMRSGSREILYSKGGLDWLLDRVEGTVEMRATPATCGLQWPLMVGKEWEEKYLWENLKERTTENRLRRYTVEAVESVTVPAGTFQAFRVTSKDPTGRLVHEYWYAPEARWLVKERIVFSYGVQERELVTYRLKPIIAPSP